MGELLTLLTRTTQKTPASETPDRGFSYTKCLFAEAGLSAQTASKPLENQLGSQYKLVGLEGVFFQGVFNSYRVSIFVNPGLLHSRRTHFKVVDELPENPKTTEVDPETETGVPVVGSSEGIVPLKIFVGIILGNTLAAIGARHQDSQGNNHTEEKNWHPV
jgi:hypothetical protein